MTDKADNLTVQTVGLVTLMLMIKTSNDDKEKNSDDSEDMYNNDDEGEGAYLTDGYGGPIVLIWTPAVI